MINLQDPPPRRWIEHTIGSCRRMQRLSRILERTVLTLAGADPDLVLANRIIDDAPEFLYGENVANRYAHGGWALLTLGRNEEAWQLMGPLLRSASTFLSIGNVPIPTDSILILIYAALRRGDGGAARLGIQLARLRQMTLPEAEDLEMLEACLRTAA